MVTFNPIGTVKIENGRTYLELDRNLFAATQGLEEFSHILTLCWFHLYDSEENRRCLVLNKPYRNGPERIGVLATRSPVRINPIAVSTCKLLNVDRERCRLEVAYIDAENGTPLLDIKPYQPSNDRVKNVRLPAWAAHWPDCLEASESFDWEKEFSDPG